MIALALLFFFIVWIINATLGTWAVMLGLGNLHHIVATIPALGFYDVFSFWIWFSFAISLVVTGRNSS